MRRLRVLPIVRSVALVVSVAAALGLTGIVLADVGPGGASRAPASAKRPSRKGAAMVVPPLGTAIVVPRATGMVVPRSRLSTGLGAAKPAQAVVVIPSPAAVLRVPRSFLGISTEYWALPLFERHSALLARVLSLLQVQGGGPLVLRIGGDSADSTFWDPSARRLPRWAFKLTPAWFAQTGTLLDQLGARLILDLNLVTDTPARAAQIAAAARDALPRGSIVGFEVGNEPDLYSHTYWHATISRAGFGGSALPSEISAAGYARDFQSYARVLAGVAPDVPLVGPVTAYPALDLDWISRLLAGPHARLGTVSAHLYPYSACVDRSSPSYPTIARLLSETATAGLAEAIGPAVRLAHRAGLPLRLTELNSVTCGGLRGVSNTFATALWAPDALFELLHAGVDGVNVHIREQAINGAFALRNHGLIARPLLYGLILFARALGQDARLVRARVRAARSLHLSVWAVRMTGGVLHVLLIDKSDRSATVRLQLPTNGPASVQRLLAPSAGSRSGVTLDGQQLGDDARWQGRPANDTIPPGTDGYELTVPRLSAALFSMHLSPAALAGGNTSGRHRHAVRANL